jgi:hypothetical protein
MGRVRVAAADLVDRNLVRRSNAENGAGRLAEQKTMPASGGLRDVPQTL